MILKNRKYKKQKQQKIYKNNKYNATSKPLSSASCKFQNQNTLTVPSV